MAQKKILLDTNAYLRLAHSIHPLLFKEFGKSINCLYVIPELDKEFSKNSRLVSKFYWVNQPEYHENRQKLLTISREQRKQLKIIPDYLKSIATQNKIDVSRVDLLVLAYEFVLGVEVVTDDKEMLKLAQISGIMVLKTLELLKRMLEADHIDKNKLEAVVGYWEATSDTPANFFKDYQRLFKENPPNF